MAVVRAGNDGKLLLSSVAYSEETQRRKPDSSLKSTWQDKEQLAQDATCEICKVVASACLTTGPKPRYKKEIRNGHVLH